MGHNRNEPARWNHLQKRKNMNTLSNCLIALIVPVLLVAAVLVTTSPPRNPSASPAGTADPVDPAPAVSFSDLSPTDGALVSTPILFSGTVSSTGGLSKVALWGDWSGTWREEAVLSWSGDAEILRNGGFESYEKDGTATDWTIDAAPGVDYAIGHEIDFADYTYRIDIIQTATGGLSVHQEPRFDLGQEYSLSVWYKTSGSNALGLQVSDGAGMAVIVDAVLPATSGTWQTFSTTFVYDDPAADQVRVHSIDAGTFFLDEFSLVATGSQKLPVSVNAAFFRAPPGGLHHWALAATNGGGTFFGEQFSIDVASSVDGWRVLPVRSKAEFERGAVGGEGLQHMLSLARSRSDPDVVYMSHDCGQVWQTVNNGAAWRKTLGNGLWSKTAYSIAVDPVDSDTLLLIAYAGSNYFDSGYDGIYRSTDGGQNWDWVLFEEKKNPRHLEQNLAHDPSSVDRTGAQRWYAAFEAQALYRSDDSGATWSALADLSAHGHVYSVRVHSTDGTVYLATSLGLYTSVDQGSTIQPLGDLPAGTVSGLQVVELYPNVIAAVVADTGLYLSNDGGQTFSLLRSWNEAAYVFVNQGFPGVVYLTGLDGDAWSSQDWGATWTETDTFPENGLWRDSILLYWLGEIAGSKTGISPDPRTPTEAIAFANATFWKTRDAVDFESASTLFTGYNCEWWARGIVFDRTDPNRFGLLTADAGLVYTDSRGDHFERYSIDRDLIGTWSSMHGADFQPGTNVVVGGVGSSTTNRKLVRTEIVPGWHKEDWSLVDADDGSYLVVTFHPDDPNLVFAEGKRSTDGGSTWQTIPDLSGWGAGSLNAMVMGICDADRDVLYALNGDRDTILRSDDRGDTWYVYESVSWDFRPKDSKPTFAVDPLDRDKVWAIDSGNDLAVFDGTSWRSTGVLGLVGSTDPKNFVRSVVVDPNDNNVVYAGMYATGIPPVWRSVDGGYTWEDISQNLPRVGAAGLSINPHTGEILRGGCDGTWIYPPPYASSNLLYDKAVPRP